MTEAEVTKFTRTIRRIKVITADFIERFDAKGVHISAPVFVPTHLNVCLHYGEWSIKMDVKNVTLCTVHRVRMYI